MAADVNCLVAATHFLPLFLVSTDVHALVPAATSTVYLSHRNRDPVAAAEFLTRTFHHLFHQQLSLDMALEQAAVETKDPFISKCLQDAKNKVNEAMDPNSDLSKQVSLKSQSNHTLKSQSNYQSNHFLKQYYVKTGAIDSIIYPNSHPTPTMSLSPLSQELVDDVALTLTLLITLTPTSTIDLHPPPPSPYH